MTGSIDFVETVLGRCPSDQIGVTLMHEHLLIDFSVRYDPSSSDVDDLDEASGPIERGRLMASPAAFRANLIRDSVDDATGELAEFSAVGGRTVVDLTTVGLGHDRAGLREASVRSGVHVVAGTGYYVHATHPDWLHQASVEEIASSMAHDIEVGDTAGVKCGVIGEIGIDDFLDCELQVLDAAVVAQVTTGASVAVHVRSGVIPEFREQTLGLVQRFVDAGGDPHRLIVCHQDGTGTDAHYQDALLSFGVVLSYDTFGFEASFKRHGFHFRLPSDAERVSDIVSLWHRGWGRQVVLSHDLCYAMMTRRWGGWGLAHLLGSVRPMFVEAGLSEENMTDMLVGTPRRLLSRAVN